MEILSNREKMNHALESSRNVEKSFNKPPSTQDPGHKGRQMKELERIHLRERIEREKSLIRDISQVF